MKKSNKLNNGEFQIFNLYKEAINSDIFVSYEKVVASSLLESSLGFKSPEYLEFDRMYNEGISKKFDLIFDFFIVHFDVDLKINMQALVPTIKFEESSNVDGINFKSNQPGKLGDFLTKINSRIETLLEKGMYVEIFPNIVVFKSKNTNSLKIVFDSSQVLYRG
ncbi:DUF2714 domain-containing protein [Mycoplasma tauri]|uniref:DUF2714 domain-containing protein n=1 Tax=Mycoplasma tauri TaxID=547987 RepID=A0A953NEX3_9MOLU|nr:DUF2714 domain-containing protein [Mycoplasma tauri]MBZ4195668.1 DUF2714 domain-containing protein [Mycoplasma tauri]MBZ4203953.1 DUF2714 domain-containing protein [Mycoplasma tauri]MBZ4204111.1 DUF2714 domain-containing protein [Mycoplasma tauri]MBZ4212486.1 DUF2714 domain-containing protein [Mycoplasma tauri]MBZ4226517.1 DUF2714 domain-containing protein [Mycoplasma tauri]